jgi:release factor glutamine methyltransferase
MTQTIAIKNTLQSATEKLFAEEAKLEAQLLLQHALKVNRAWLIAHENDALEANIHAVFEALLNRRLNGEPMAYILGAREFYGLNLKVTPDTLIPRPDTETLVEAALEKIPLDPSFRRKSESSGGELIGKKTLDSDFRRNDHFSILDLGTGSGAIALAIAKHRPQAHLTAVDASENALKLAQENAQNLQIANVQFVISNWFDALINQRFDMIVSNPPYIEANDIHLTQGDLRFEPLIALASGQDGLDDIRKIVQTAPQHLNPHGWLMLEHGYNQAESVAALFKQAGFTEISHALDLAGINRVTSGMMPR